MRLLIADAGAPAPSPAAPLPVPLAGKLRPPLDTAFELPRTEVCERIFNAGAARLVLLRAPAGFGKTTVMLQVRRRFEETGLPHAWLTLDRADNDVGRLLAVLIAALEPLIPALRRLQPGGPAGADELAFALIDAVAALPTPFALFLDDLEELQGAVGLGLLQELIAQLPRGAQLIAGSRGAPELGLGRLRARGRLLEIEPEQLRFSEAEVDGYLRERRGLALQPEDIRRLHRSTEGWVAALWLASVTLEDRDEPGRFIAGFSGSNAAVMDYLMEDVLARQSETVRAFLLHTSILARFDASLCDAVCAAVGEQHDSAGLLRAIDQAHLFLIPLQADRSEFRYHGMFAEFLRAQLRRQHPGRIAVLHRAAADWFLASARPVPAIEHGLAAGDLDFALPLLRAHAQPLLDQGRVRMLSRWLDPLHQAGRLHDQPLLQVVHAWAVCLADGPRAAGPLADALGPAVHDDPHSHAILLALQPLLMVLTDRTDEAMDSVAPLLKALPSSASFARSFLEVVLANLSMIAGRYPEALRLADAARSRQPAHASSFNFAISEAAEGAVDLTQGRLHKALARLRLAVSAGAADSTRATNGNAMAGVLLAEALYEADQCEQAERLLAVYIPLIRRVGIPDQLIGAHIVMARIAREQGDADRAQRLLTELEHIGHREGLPRVVACARVERARSLVVEGRLAHAELERCNDKALWRRVSRLSLRANEVETHDVGLARWSIASGHADEVADLLRRQLDAAERAHRERRALTLRLLLAQALYRLDQRNKAMRVLAKAVRQAAAEGYVRAFLDEDAYLLTLLRDLRAVPTLLLDGAREGSADAPLAFIDRLLREPPTAVAEARPAEAPGVRSAAAASELLTRKEIQVMRLAAEGLSNDDIAERLFVAETTVRTHLRNINVKLDARNRMEAIALTRKAGLIP
ncbi:LuxR C-terminal-related transcriptional regulator [Pseudacidovorax intermedius]|uniref:LuxR C-terminal-related transcriptional regulator n=1 Tax=Pseudacidovorax intermedius TaxID=433924 RepID=UPI0026F15CB9|nr:LuxR C-terminal-related transcriptional regulator [Pseudacidovorax intermedius]